VGFVQKVLLSLGVVFGVTLGGSHVAAQTLDLRFSTTTLGQKYAPRNIVAVWIEDGAGSFVKTIGRWSGSRTVHLVDWIAASGQDTDAVSGATRSNHQVELLASWDLKDRQGAIVPDGDYQIRVEISEDNVADGNGTSSVAVLPFVKDGLYRSEPGLADGNVQGATIDYLEGPAGEDGDPDGPSPDEPGSEEGPAPDDGLGSSGQSSAVVGSCAAAGALGARELGLVVLLLAFLVGRRRRSVRR